MATATVQRAQGPVELVEVVGVGPVVDTEDDRPHMVLACLPLLHDVLLLISIDCPLPIPCFEMGLAMVDLVPALIWKPLEILVWESLEIPLSKSWGVLIWRS